VFKSDYNYNQIRQLAIYSGINPILFGAVGLRPVLRAELSPRNSGRGSRCLPPTPCGAVLRRLGLTYSFSRSSFAGHLVLASESYFEAINFIQWLVGPQLPDRDYFQPDHADVPLQHH